MITALLVGALSGWLASIIMKTDAQQGAVLNIIIGIIGAVIAQYIFGGMLHLGGAAEAGQSFHPLDILWGVAGSVVLIGILKALRLLK